jgi:hypothetical protein
LDVSAKTTTTHTFCGHQLSIVEQQNPCVDQSVSIARFFLQHGGIELPRLLWLSDDHAQLTTDERPNLYLPSLLKEGAKIVCRMHK